MNEYKLVKKIIEKQWKLNDKTLKNWRKELNEKNWQQAILVETGEALDSAGYKWWKKQTIDLDNIKVELIDILHFVTSLLYYYPKKYDEFTVLFISGNVNNTKKLVGTDNKINEEILKDFRNILLSIGQMKTIETLAFELGKAFSYLNLDIKDIFVGYMTKNILNEFRQLNGYKTGNYIKTWEYNESEVEDNVVAFQIASNIKDYENFEDILMKELNKYYKKHVLKN